MAEKVLDPFNKDGKKLAEEKAIENIGDPIEDIKIDHEPKDSGSDKAGGLVSVKSGTCGKPNFENKTNVNSKLSEPFETTAKHQAVSENKQIQEVLVLSEEYKARILELAGILKNG